MTRTEMIKSWFSNPAAVSEFDAPKKREALAYIEQLEETISLMKIQMRGDCGTCRNKDALATCDRCLSRKEYHPLWEYEGLPEVKAHG